MASRQELRLRVRELERNQKQLVERLEATNRELALHALWCRDGERVPNLPRRLFNRFWVWLTAAFS